MKKFLILVLGVVMSVSVFSKEIMVSAAASLKNCLEEIIPQYEKDSKNTLS